jgi:hypothetical protein
MSNMNNGQPALIVTLADQDTQGYLSSLETGEKEAGSAGLLGISRECGKSVDWLLTGQVHRNRPTPSRLHSVGEHSVPL